MAANLGLSGGVTGGHRLPRTFFDSNILIYAEDAGYPARQEIAIRLILEHGRQRSGVVSLQVLGEYFSAVTRKLMLDPEIARSQVEFYSRFHLVQPALSDTLAAIDHYRLHGFSYWDSLILQCSRQSGCSVPVTENLQHGRVIGGVKIVNPFH
jgi:predicted nucleic acid-binding protein